VRGCALLLAAAAVAALGLAAPALGATGTDEMGGAAQPARALALQALALLEQNRGHEEALQKLDQALAARDKTELHLRALRAAHEALHRESVAEAARLLRNAFPAGSSHVVGVTYRPRIATARVAAGLAGAGVLAAAAAGLLRRRRHDQRHGAV
jgi:hypothetical protein